MNKTDSAGRLFAGLSDVREEYLNELDDMAPKRHSRRLPLLLAAVLLLTLLCGTVAAAVRGEGITEFFGEAWLRLTGEAMGAAQEALIRGLSQEIGRSRTVDGVTVTVDSAAVGDDSFQILLRVTGVLPRARADYRFDGFSCWPAESAASMSACGCSFQGGDGAGALLFLVRYTSVAARFTPEGDPVPVELTLRDLTRRGPFGDREKVEAAGEWSFRFDLDLREAFQILSLGDVEAEWETFPERQPFRFTARDVTVTSTGIRFCHDSSRELPDPDQFVAILSDGAEIPCDENLGNPDGEDFLCTAHFRIPVNLNDLAALRIGNTEVRIP